MHGTTPHPPDPEVTCASPPLHPLGASRRRRRCGDPGGQHAQLGAGAGGHESDQLRPAQHHQDPGRPRRHRRLLPRRRGIIRGQIPWLLNNASRVAGNEPWNVVPGFKASSLRIGPGGSAASGYDCNATGEDSIRFFYRSPGVPGSTLHVSIAVATPFGVAPKTYDLPGTTSGWALSGPLAVPNQRGFLGAQIVTFAFSTTGTPATWLIDDVLVDPWKPL